MNWHPYNAAQTGNLSSLEWRCMGIPRFGTKPVKWSQVSISLTLNILFEYSPLSPTDPWNVILLKKPSAINAPTQWSKYFSFFPSLVSATKNVRLANWPVSVWASSKARWHCHPIWLCESYPEDFLVYGIFLLMRQTSSLNMKGFEKRHSCGLVLCHVISERWKLDKWQIMALASPQSLGRIWVSESHQL